MFPCLKEALMSGAFTNPEDRMGLQDDAFALVSCIKARDV